LEKIKIGLLIKEVSDPFKGSDTFMDKKIPSTEFD